MSPITTETRRGFQEIQLDPGAVPGGVPSRGARMPQFLSLPKSMDPTSVLSKLRVGCLGVGAVGRIAAMHLARLGVEALYICDRSLYKPESLLTQPIDPDEVGRPKAETVARLAKRLSPSTRIYAYDGPFEELGPVAFADVDLILIATDNIRAEVDCGQHCMNLGKPLIQASVHGATLTAQVRFFANATAEGPCPACGLTVQERSALAGEVVYSCDGSVVQTPTAPTNSTSHLCALAGDLLVNQVLRYVLGLGKPVVDHETEWNGFTLQTRVTPMKRKPLCTADHVVWTTYHTERPVGDCTLRDVAKSADMHEGISLNKATFRVGGASYVERGVCSSGHGRPVERFVGRGGVAAPCPDCGDPLRPEPFFTHDSVPSRLLLTQLDRPLRELCTEPPDWVLIGLNGNAVLFRSMLERERRSSR